MQVRVGELRLAAARPRGPHLAPGPRAGLAPRGALFRRDVGWVARVDEGREGHPTGRSWVALG